MAISAIATSNHKRIVQMLRGDDTPSYYNLTLENRFNSSLYSTLDSANKGLPWKWLEQIAIDCAEGLTYLHGKKISPTTLNSSNALVDHTLRPRLSNFGHAYAPKADVHRYATMLWELVGGALPHTKEIPQECPAEHRKWIEKGWEKDPSKRPKASEIARALKQAQQRGGPGLDSTPPGLPGEKEYSQADYLLQQNEYEKALPYLEAAANAGHPFPCFLLFFGHANKQLTDAQLDRYREMLPIHIPTMKRFALAGYTNAQVNLGLCFEHGEGTEKNKVEAFRYYKMAADLGELQAQFNLGLCFKKGPWNPEK